MFESQQKQQQSEADHFCKMNKTIKIWSYNLFLRPPPIKNNGDDFKEERFEMIVNRLSEFDIVCFQQLFQTASFRPEKMIEAAIQRGFYYWKICDQTSFVSGKPVDAGIAVLSKFPILESHFESYGIGILSDSASDKGYIYCRINVQGSTLHLFNTHKQASYNTPGREDLRDLSVAARMNQSKILKNRMREILAKNYGKGDLILMTGDFNINANQNTVNLPLQTPITAQNPESFHQYDEMVHLFSSESQLSEPILPTPYQLRDLLLLNKGHHPVTYGEEEEMILMDPHEFGIHTRIDYIFQIAEIGVQTSLAPDIKSCEVDKSLVKGKDFKQLSDHYGLTLTLAIAIR